MEKNIRCSRNCITDKWRTMSTVTSPTLEDPYCLRNSLIRSASFGIFSAKIFFKSVEASLNDLTNTADVIFCKKKQEG